MTAANRYWQRARTARFSRRRVLQGIVRGGAGIAAAGLIGCTGRKGPATVGHQAGQPRPGGTLNFMAFTTGVFARGFDPHVLQESEVSRMRPFYQGLLRPHIRTHDPEPELAQRWEQPSPIEYVFALVPGVKWHNKPPAGGRDLIADDVVFSLNRLQTNEPAFINRSLLDTVDKIEAVDKMTIKLTLRTPDVSILAGLAASPAAILAPEVVERAGGKFETADKAVGTGPFILQSKDDTAAVAVRNPDYYKPGLPYLDGVRFHAFSDRQARWAAFLAGRLDLDYAPGEVAQKYRAERGQFVVEPRYTGGWFPDPGMQGMYTNVQKPPFNDPRVYRALRLLVDYEEHIRAGVEVEVGRGRLASVFPAALEGWDFSEEEYITRFLAYQRPKDEAVRVALELLRAAGFTRDNPLKFELLALQDPGLGVNIYTSLMDAQLRRLGQGVVQHEMKPVDATTQNAALARGNFDVSTSGMPATAVEPDAYLRVNYHSKGGRNRGKWNDPKADQMIDAQRGIFDVAQRKAAIKEIIAYLIENAPYTAHAGRYSLTAAQPRVHDWAPSAVAWAMTHQFEQVWLST